MEVMKKLKGDENENNFQFEIINWDKRIAIKIKKTKSQEKINWKVIVIFYRSITIIEVERGEKDKNTNSPLKL
jgi:hypothetical protein